MAKPIKYYGRRRIRWDDENGHRKSEVFDDFKTAAYELKKREAGVEEIKKGLRAAFNPYDAELISLIQKDDRNRDLVIINPSPRARDIAGTLLGSNPKRRVDFDPDRSEEIVKKWMW